MLRKFFRNKLVLAALCLVVAAVVGFVLLPMANAGTRKTAYVYRTRTTIYQYQKITAGMVKRVEVGSYNLPPQAVTDEKQLVGKTAKTEITQDDTILKNQLLTGTAMDAIMAQASADGKRVVSLTLPNLAASVSGKIQPGDIVSVLTYVTATSTSKKKSFSNGITGNTSYSTRQDAVLNKALKYVQVAALSSNTGANVTDNTVTDSAGSRVSAVPSTVTFVCAPKQASLLATIQKKGDAYLEFVARGARAAKILKNQEGD